MLLRSQGLAFIGGDGEEGWAAELASMPAMAAGMRTHRMERGEAGSLQWRGEKAWSVSGGDVMGRAAL